MRSYKEFKFYTYFPLIDNGTETKLYDYATNNPQNVIWACPHSVPVYLNRWDTKLILVLPKHELLFYLY